jgi:hypothetical protein
LTLPKLTAAGGVTPKVFCATALAEAEQALSFPLRSIAVTETK